MSLPNENKSLKKYILDFYSKFKPQHQYATSYCNLLYDASGFYQSVVTLIIRMQPLFLHHKAKYMQL